MTLWGPRKDEQWIRQCPLGLQGSFSFILVMRPLQLLETQMHLFVVVKNARHVKTLRRFITQQVFTNFECAGCLIGANLITESRDKAS